LEEIKESYRKLVLKYHPDRKTGNADMFDLVTHAFSVLSNVKTRKEYDQIYKLSKSVEKTHLDLRDNAIKYMSHQESDGVKKTEQESKTDFNKIFEELDIKHNYKREIQSKKISEKETEHILDDLLYGREQDDIESLHNDIFENGQFDISKFNEAFDTVHSSHNELIPHNGNPLAWNLSTEFESFSPVSNYEDIYTEDDNIGNSIYGSVKINNDPKKKLTKSDVDKLKGTKYTKEHNVLESNYLELTEKKIKERDLLFANGPRFTDFDTNPDCGGYGILSQISTNELHNNDNLT